LTSGYTINSQRLALLRLLAGWAVLLRVLDCPVFADHFTRPVRVFLSRLLFKAELAAGFLVVAVADVLIRRGFVRADSFDALAYTEMMVASLFESQGSDDALSVARLRVRVNVLKRVLGNLPRAARQLLRGLCGGAGRSVAPCIAWLKEQHAGMRSLWVFQRIDRPPDKGGSSGLHG